MRRGWELLIVAIAFAVSRLLWARANVPFRSDVIDFFAQLLDPPLLQERLLESLWYLHAQPPLLNLLAGIALRISPANPGGPLSFVFLLAGLATCLALFSVLRDLGANRWLAAALAVAFVSTPTFIVYEHWFFYPHLSATLLAVAAACLLRAGSGRGRWMAAGFGALAVLVWLRSLFHPVWFLTAVAVALARTPAARRRRVLVATSVPAALVLFLALKNLAMFGFFGTSSWGGNSLHRMMTETLPPEEVSAMVERGDLGRISLEWEFSPPEVYLEILGPGSGDTGVPALDTTGKTRARENPVNYNHWIYLEAGRAYLRGALRMLREHPGTYVTSVQWTVRRFLDPVTDDHFLRPMRFRVRRSIVPFEAAQRSPWLRVLVAACVVSLAVRLASGRIAEREWLLTAFVVGTIVWVVATGVLLEFGENNRFRYQIGPLLLISVFITARDAVRLLRGRLRPTKR